MGIRVQQRDDRVWQRAPPVEHVGFKQAACVELQYNLRAILLHH
jgi:hypothetical protein